MEGFTYVVNPPEIPRIAFGSSLERDVLPLSGPQVSPFMKSIQGEHRTYPGPLEYAISKPLGKKYASKYGFSSLISKAPRLISSKVSKVPPLGTYNVDYKAVIKNVPKYTVDVDKELKEELGTPGPTAYTYHYEFPVVKVSLAFGAKRRIAPAVAIFCKPTNLAKCIKCGRTPYGDYWHNFQRHSNMCRACMKKEEAILSNCNIDSLYQELRNRYLDNFVPARYCGFFHDHHGTSAATQILNQKLYRLKFNTENYLYRFEKRFY